MEGRAVRVPFGDPVERELRRHRPVARSEYVSLVVGSISTPTRRAASWRLLLACAFSLALVGPFVALGGLGAVTASTNTFATFTKEVVSNPREERNIVSNTPADDQFFAGNSADVMNLP